MAVCAFSYASASIFQSFTRSGWRSRWRSAMLVWQLPDCFFQLLHIRSKLLFRHIHQTVNPVGVRGFFPHVVQPLTQFGKTLFQFLQIYNFCALSFRYCLSFLEINVSPKYTSSESFKPIPSNGGRCRFYSIFQGNVSLVS